MAKDPGNRTSSLPPESSRVESTWDDDAVDSSASPFPPAPDNEESEEDRVTIIPDLPMSELARFLMDDAERRGDSEPTQPPDEFEDRPTPLLCIPVEALAGGAQKSEEANQLEPQPVAPIHELSPPPKEHGDTAPSDPHAPRPTLPPSYLPDELDSWGEPLPSRTSEAPTEPPPPVSDPALAPQLPLLSQLEPDEFGFLDNIFPDTGDSLSPPTRRPDTPLPPPSLMAEAPPLPQTTEQVLRQELKARYAVGDFSGALDEAEKLLALAPQDSDAQRYAESCREVLTQMYTARLGRMDQRIMMAIASDQIRWLSLDHRAGFLLSLVDGSSTVEELLDISGMPRLDALRILCGLFDQRIVSLVQSPLGR